MTTEKTETDTASLIIWGVLITLSLSAMVIAAGARAAVLHMVMAGLVSVGIALVAIFENVKQRSNCASKTEIAAATARNMGLVYIWGALGIALTYGLVLHWHEWWHFLAAFATAGTLCIAYSNMLARDAAAGRTDAAMLSVGNYLTWAQLVGMVIAIVGMLVDNKLTRYYNPNHQDWAAQNIFFFGAVALALISGFALWAARKDAPVGAA